MKEKHLRFYKVFMVLAAFNAINYLIGPFIMEMLTGAHIPLHGYLGIFPEMNESTIAFLGTYSAVLYALGMMYKKKVDKAMDENYLVG